MKGYDEFTKARQNNMDERKVFEFLCIPENIYSMVMMSELGLPALSGVVKEIEDKFSDLPDFPLSEENRKIVGKMAKFILAQFGYAPVTGSSDEEMRLRCFTGAHIFKFAHIYKKDGAADHSLKVVIA